MPGRLLPARTSRGPSRWGPLAVVAALALAPAAAAASPILEAHVGARPRDVDAVLAPVRDELVAAGFEDPRATAATLEARVSRPGRAAAPAALDAAVSRIEAGFALVVAGEFDRALGELDHGLADLGAATASVAGDDRLRGAIQRGLIGRALAHERLGAHARARAALAELVRGFPDRPIDYQAYGPEPRDRAAAVARALAAGGTGDLVVTIDDRDAELFLDERPIGLGGASVTALVPGDYRLFVRRRGRPGRVHPVSIATERPTEVALSWTLDAALRTDGGVPALVFADDAARRRDEARLATRLGRALGAPSVALLGVETVGGRLAVRGAIVPVDGRAGRHARVVLGDARQREQLRALGRYLAGDDDAAARIEVLDRPRVPTLARPRFGGWAWLALGAGVASVAGGVTLVAIDRDAVDDGVRNRQVRNSAPAGYALGGLGVALTSVAIGMLIHDHRAVDGPPDVALSPTAGGARLDLVGRF
jgi:hypothetical protein